MDLADRIFKDIIKYKKVSLILAGGSSPLKYYRRLFSKKNNWSKLNLFLLDERLVKINSKFSNFYNINKIIQIYKLNIKFNRLNIEFKKNKNIKKTVRLIKKNYTISILGMGNDGHYASIFKNSYKLCKSKSFEIIKNSHEIYKRITLNEHFFKNVKNLYVVINHPKKNNILTKIYKKNFNSDDKILELLLERSQSKKIFY